MTSEEEILSKLVYKEEDVIKDLGELVEKAGGFIRIEPKGGKVVFVTDAQLSTIDKVLLVLIGKYFAARLKFIDNSAVSLKELTDYTGTPSAMFSKYLTEKRRTGVIRRTEDTKEARYTIVYHQIHDVLDELINKYRVQKNG
jgi:hypothetical protein